MLGNLILQGLGRPDPRQRLLASALGQPAGGSATPAGGAGAPGTAPPGAGAGPSPAPAQPSSLQTPPDLMALYTELSDYGRRADAVDRGIGLIGAAFAQPENRAAIMNQFDGSSMDEGTLFDTVIGIGDRQREIEEQARLVQQGITAASGLGIDESTARYLAETGTLGNLITARMSADKAQRRTQVVGDAQSGFRLIDLDTGETISEISPPAGPQPLEPTSDIQNYEYYRTEETAAGRTPKSFEEWRLTKPPSTSITVDTAGNPMNAAVGKLIEEADKTLVSDRESVSGAASTIDALNNARVAMGREGGIVAGSPLSEFELGGRRILGNLFGITDPAVVNSDQFMASLAPVLTGRIKELGTGNAISDADRKFMEGAVGMDRALSPAATQRILNSLEIGTRNQAIDYNERVQDRIDAIDDPEVKQYLETLKVQVPPLSQAALSHVPPGDIEILVQNANDPDAIREFEAIYGRNTAAEILRLAGG